MGVLTETLSSIYTFLGDFLAFLKNHRILDSYVLVHSDVSDAVIAQKDEEFVENLLTYLEQLQGLLGTCSREKHYVQLDSTGPYSCFSERENASKLPRNSIGATNVAEVTDAEVAWQENSTEFEVTPRNESFDALFEITPKDDALQPQVDAHKEEKSTEKDSDEETARDQAAIDREESTDCNGEVTEEANVNNKEVELQQTLPEGRSFTCVACHGEFRDRASLSRHFRKHTGEKPFMCEHCKKCFSSKVSLNAHLLRTHNIGIEKALCCTVCGKLFSRKYSLEVHMTIHRESKPFECGLCHHTFAQKISLNIHIASQHTGELNYNCKVCKKSFVTSSALNTHRLSHGPPQFECDLCRQKFRRRDVLKLHHETRHGPPVTHTHRCSCCDKAFRTTLGLTAHLRVCMLLAFDLLRLYCKMGCTSVSYFLSWLIAFSQCCTNELKSVTCFTYS